ncbi:hypothetical protein Megpolyxen_01934 (plasmid) [Candidatus Megaera polyxenophila]|jgi:hypothetical protein|nr:hypothetical protein Megpolyxen_01934 [Candidatus Megaera polyxenophila]
MNSQECYGKVVKVFEDCKLLVINKGSEQGIKKGQEFLVYDIGEELFDPDTKESLGRVEIVKGTGKVTNVQLKQATIASRNYEEHFEHSGVGLFLNNKISRMIQIPFYNPKIGDYIRPI